MENSIKDQIIALEQQITEERERLSTDRMDISFGELINLYKNKELIIRPEYQRLFRWNIEQKTSLIESILLGIPIPPIFVAEDANGIWELVDGLQRVSTFISFFGELMEDLSSVSSLTDDQLELFDEEIFEENSSLIIKLGNKWKLDAGSLVPSLDGLDIDTLPTKYRLNLKRAVCRVEILRGESNIAMKYELFKRLNSGGSKLTPQEIRNALYRQSNPIVNLFLVELSQNQIFQRLTALSKQKKQELYDQELILRFIALYKNLHSINNNLENFLDHFMDQATKPNAFEPELYKSIFIEVLELINTVGDDKLFRNDRGLFVPALFEGITIGIAEHIHIYRGNPKLVLDKISELRKDTEFKRFSGSASNSRSRIKNRLTRANQIFSSIPDFNNA